MGTSWNEYSNLSPVLRQSYSARYASTQFAQSSKDKSNLDPSWEDLLAFWPRRSVSSDAIAALKNNPSSELDNALAWRRIFFTEKDHFGSGRPLGHVAKRILYSPSSSTSGSSKRWLHHSFWLAKKGLVHLDVGGTQGSTSCGYTLRRATA
jgi:hypothetical protein